MFCSKIPSLSPRMLKSLFQHIRPVMRFARSDSGPKLCDYGELHFILVNDPEEIFTVNPRPGCRAKRLRKIGAIQTYHYWSSSTPEVVSASHEVLAQIPRELLDRVVAFEIVTDVHQGNIDGNYIRTETILYERFQRRR